MKTKIKQLIKLVEESNIDELEVSSFWGGQKIRVTKNRSIDKVQPVLMQQPANPQSTQETISFDSSLGSKEIDSISEKENNVHSTDINQDSVIGEEFTAPLVGTFYQSAKPGTPPFVKEGDSITKGQIICIIEAMKIFNEIEAEHSGIVKKILVKDGTPVEYGQALMIIDAI